MLRTTIVRSIRPLSICRPLSTSTRVMAEGSTGSGSSRPTGIRGGDSFTKREAANEEQYIRQQEKEKLLELREKLNAQKQHLSELEKHIDEIQKEQGGEQH